MPSEDYQATIDSVAIVRQLSSALGGVSEPEIHMLAYLSCLLALFKGHAAAEWGYHFIRAEWGAPYSASVNEAIRTLQSAGLLRDTGISFELTDDGITFTQAMVSMEEHAWRTPYIDGACGSVLALPTGTVRSALGEEPSMRQAKLHKQARRLLSEAGVDPLYRQFEALGAAVGLEVKDLLVPSVVWLSYLAETAEREEHDFLHQDSSAQSEQPAT
jgi:hypothetical protein